MEDSDVVLLVLDATAGIESQDLAIFTLAVKRHKGVVILVNKWDLIEGKETNTARDLEAKLKHKLAPFNDVPILFISVLEKQRIHRTLDVALDVYNNRIKKLKTSELNDVCLLYTSPSPRDRQKSRMPSSA